MGRGSLGCGDIVNQNVLRVNGKVLRPIPFGYETGYRDRKYRR